MRQVQIKMKRTALRRTDLNVLKPVRIQLSTLLLLSRITFNPYEAQRNGGIKFRFGAFIALFGKSAGEHALQKIETVPCGYIQSFFSLASWIFGVDTFEDTIRLVDHFGGMKAVESDGGVG